MAVIIGDQPVAQRLVGSRLQALVEAGAHRQPRPVQHLVAITSEQLASDLLGEIGCRHLLGLLPASPLDRLPLDLGRFCLGHRPVLDHAVDDPIAARLCCLRAARWVVAVGRFREPREKSGFAERQLIERFVEIGLCGGGHAIGAGTEVNLVEIEFEDAVLRQRHLDASGQEDLFDLALDRDLVGQQHVLGNLLSDRRGPNRPAISLEPPYIGDCGTHYGGRIDPVMVVEILVLGREKGVDDEFWDRLDRHENPPLGRVFSEKAAVAGMHSSGDRRLIMSKLLIIRQISPEMPDRDADERAADDCQRHAADK